MINVEQSRKFRLAVSYGEEIMDIVIGNWGEDFETLWGMLYEKLFYFQWR